MSLLSLPPETRRLFELSDKIFKVMLRKTEMGYLLPDKLMCLEVAALLP